MSFPSYFEVRWTEFCNSMLTAILRSWLALVRYFQYSKEKRSKGFYSYLTTLENLELLSFMADVLTVFSRYQKILQSNNVTILDVEKHTSSVKLKITALLETPLLGGWVATLKESFKRGDDNTLQMREISLTETKSWPSRRKEHHLYVSERRDVKAVCNEIVQTLNNFLDIRFSIDIPVLSAMKPYTTLTKDADLKVIWEFWGKDLDLEQLNLEYQDILTCDEIEHLRSKQLSELVSHFASSKHFKTTATLLARVLAAKPHSADVERLISSSVCLKSIDRSTMSIETENLYLHAYFNMPVLEQWDPRPAVLHWIKSVNRRAKETTKARQQDWYRGIFPEASKRNYGDLIGEENDEYEPYVPPTKIKKF